LDQVLDRVADAASSLWPDWYISEPADINERGTLELLQGRVHTAGLDRQVLPHWLYRADIACRANMRPRAVGDFTSEVEVRQLALALGTQTVHLVLGIQGENQDSAAILGLARITEWLAREAKLSVVVLVPASVGVPPELDSISFGAVTLERGICPPATDSDLVSVAEKPTLGQNAEHLASNRRVRLPKPRQRPVLLVHPLVGRPHPGSQGERLLWARLREDPELAEYFLCNQWVYTACGSTYLVDFVWQRGRVIVEVDGYYWHSSKFQFSFDRRRDYELLLSGYSVVRIPHDELLADLESTVQKIRRVVQLRQAEGL